MEAALQSQKMAYEALKEVFEGLVNDAQSQKSQAGQPEEDVVYTIIPPSEGSESQFNQQ